MSETVLTGVAKRRHDLSELATKKVFRRLVPFLLLMYVIAFLDRSNVSFAQQEFEISFGISAASYAFGAGLFFVGYAVFEVPSNILLHKVGARWWLARIMVSWGIVATCFMFVQGPTSFYILRFLLGVTEAGFFPGVILFLTYWIPARHLSRARGYFYMGIALAGILGNPLSGSLLELDGVAGLMGIQWMFMIEGLPTPARLGPVTSPNTIGIELSINGETRTLQVAPWTTLLDLLREELGLTGTKKGCDHGQCGACTVLVDGKRVNSCLTLAVMKDGCERDHDRGAGRPGRRAAPDAGGLHRARRLPVRLLHAGPDLLGRGAAGGGPRAARRRRSAS